MNYIANARLMLTKCRDCLGCNRLEDEKFTGDNKCLNYRLKYRQFCGACGQKLNWESEVEHDG